MVFHWTALFFFALALGLHAWFIRKNRHLSRLVSVPVILLGFASLTWYLLVQGQNVGACPIGNPFEIISFIVWSSVFFYLIVSTTSAVNYLGFFTMGLATGLMALLQLVPSWNYAYDPATNNPSHVVGFHAALAIFSYGIFALLCLYGVMYLVQFHGIVNRRTSGFLSILPPLLRLERLQLWTLVAGVFVFSVSLFVGSFVWFHDLGTIPVFKLVFTLAVWVMYLGVLLGRITHRLLSSRFAWSVVLCFVLAMLALIPIDHARRDWVQGNSHTTEP
jgi:HemX protein